jgi:polyisoprenyl-teichoic acid--peptidoglycan teichoic acid transferase
MSPPANARRALVVLVALAAWALGSALGSVPGTAPADAAPAILVGKVRVRYSPDPTARGTVAILVAGSDARPGQDPLRSRSDSLHVILLHPAKRRAVIVGIPRDSWVAIPGHGSSKINAALAIGGPPLMVRTIERSFGVRLDYWALTSFRGIARMVDSVGGLKIRIPFRMRDRAARSNFRPGVARLRGRQVLAFSRDRHSLPSGDFGRQENGGRVILAALAQFREEYARDPRRLLRWIGAGTRNVATDVPVPELVDLAFTAAAVRPGNVRNVVLPGGTGSVGSSSVVFLSMTTARRIFDDAARDGALSPRNVPRSPTGHR